VIAQEDRCIAFPNAFQHQVQAFSLIDREKPGKRKILVFFLVDPSKKIISTLHVPPQQIEWFKEALLRECPFFRRFPDEVLDKILYYLDWPMTEEEAKLHRESLMNERKRFKKKNNKDYFERPFSLCEH